MALTHRACSPSLSKTSTTEAPSQTYSPSKTSTNSLKINRRTPPYGTSCSHCSRSSRIKRGSSRTRRSMLMRPRRVSMTTPLIAWPSTSKTSVSSRLMLRGLGYRKSSRFLGRKLMLRWRLKRFWLIIRRTAIRHTNRATTSSSDRFYGCRISSATIRTIPRTKIRWRSLTVAWNSSSTTFYPHFSSMTISCAFKVASVFFVCCLSITIRKFAISCQMREWAPNFMQLHGSSHTSLKSVTTSTSSSNFG